MRYRPPSIACCPVLLPLLTTNGTVFYGRSREGGAGRNGAQRPTQSGASKRHRNLPYPNIAMPPFTCSVWPVT